MPRLTMHMDVVVKKRLDCWVGICEPTGIMVYADSAEEADRRAHRAMEFMAKTLLSVSPARLRSYLDKHGVRYNVELSAADAPEVELARSL